MKIDRKYLTLMALAGFIITLDQATKLYVHTHFQLGESLIVILDYFSITYVRNPGAAFGILGTSNETFRTIFFLTFPPIALIILLTILKDVATKDRIQVFALSSIFGGAVGNFIDRIRFSYVIDFLDFHIGERFVWPAFNVADSAIVVGVAILILLIFRKDPEKVKS